MKQREEPEESCLSPSLSLSAKQCLGVCKSDDMTLRSFAVNVFDTHSSSARCDGRWGSNSLKGYDGKSP